MLPTDFKGLVNLLVELISNLIPLIITLILLFMTWKVIDAWVINADDPQKRRDGQTVIVASIIAVVVVSIIWGILAVLQNSLF